MKEKGNSQIDGVFSIQIENILTNKINSYFQKMGRYWEDNKRKNP